MTNNRISNLIQIKSMEPSRTVIYNRMGLDGEGGAELVICLCNTSPLPAELRRRSGHVDGLVFKAATLLPCPPPRKTVKREAAVQRGTWPDFAPPRGSVVFPAGLLQLIICSLIHHSSQMQTVYPHQGKWS